MSPAECSTLLIGPKPMIFLRPIQGTADFSAPGGAQAFLRDHADAVAYLSVTAYGEFAEEFLDRTSAAFLPVVESFELLPVTHPVADRYADVVRALRAKGKLIGANDLWIAAFLRGVLAGRRSAEGADVSVAPEPVVELERCMPVKVLVIMFAAQR